MKRSTILTFLYLSLFVINLVPASAQVILPPPCPFDAPCPPGIDTNASTLHIDFHRVEVDILNQIATTNIDLQFTNFGERLAEGTFVFPLPPGATVDQLTMWIDGIAIDAKILRKDEAREIYNEIVRQYRDPALLEYIDNDAIQANIFPIPPGDSRRVQIRYGQILEVDNGLIQYVYPLNTAGSNVRRVDQMSISVSVAGRDEVSTIYSPSHNIGISREETNTDFRVGFEASSFIPENDFSLFYGIANDTINVNLLTFRESANEDGFFMLFVQPPVTVPEDQILPKDVIIVLDQSGSMDGAKWSQAQEAATYVLGNLNPADRFNVVTFSTGWRIFSNNLEGAGDADGAINWIQGLFAEGGTDINGALSTALNLADAERSTTIMFMTDGLATEGIIETDVILQNLQERANSNVRIFTFGVGDDVDTVLLDSLVRNHRGTASYIRPTERIDEEVASLFSKIDAPVLTDIALDFEDLRVELLYPTQLPDLFAGEQLTLVGRYRTEADDLAITLSGSVNGEEQAFVYEAQNFPGNAGGQEFIARLWATRRIGDLLNSIRLNGESQELIDSVVNLSIRYGIITPYTSFLIEEDDILSQVGRERANESFRDEAEELAGTFTGAEAVEAADDINQNLANADAPADFSSLPTASAQDFEGARGAGVGGGVAAPQAPPEPQSEAKAIPDTAGAFDQDGEQSVVNPIRNVNSKTFILQDTVWNDTQYDPDTMETNQVVFLSDEYFDLLAELPELADYFALGENVIVVIDDVVYEVVPEEA